MKHCKWVYGGLLALFLAVVSCRPGAAPYRRPELPFVLPDRWPAAAPSAAKAPDPHSPWWEAFGDPCLDRLVNRVLAANLQLRQAAARLMELEAGRRQAGAQGRPQLSVAAEAARSRQETVDTTTGRRGQATTDAFSLSLPASWELDLWGRLAAAEQAAASRAVAQRYSLAALSQSLAAETASRYLQRAFLYRRLALLEENARTAETVLETVEDRLARGLATELDVRRARRDLAAAKARLPEVRRQIDQRSTELAVLATAPAPYGMDCPPATAFSPAQPGPVPPGLPADLLYRRPDVRAAEAALEAAHHDVNQARAARFPRIDLTGRLGYASDELDQLLQPQSRLWRLAAGLTAPLFDGGRLAAAQQAAEARRLQAEAAWAHTVLQALAEVRQALEAYAHLRQHHRRLAELAAQARGTFQAAEQRYRLGLADLTAVLEARKALIDARLGELDALAALYQNRIDVHRALGGGWSPPAVAAEQNEGGP